MLKLTIAYKGNLTSNLAENWMHIRFKFDGGKQINRGQDGSWQARCAGAGLGCNVGPSWEPTAWEKALAIPSAEVYDSTGTRAFSELNVIASGKVQSNLKHRGRKLNIA